MSNHPPLVPRAEAEPPFFVGIDLGGTNIKTAVVDDRGQFLSRSSFPTDAARGPEEGARRMAHSALEAIRKIGLAPSDVTRVGLGSPGTHDIPTGFLIVPPNLPGWDHFPIRDRVSAHCGLPVTFSNDANAAAYGEFWVGSGRGAESMVMFTLGTGVGCGIIIGDLIVEGQNSHGGECGHIIIDHGPAARRCSCGQLGHLEAYASATALIKRTEEALQGGRKSSIVARLEHGGSVTPLLLAEEAEGGDRLALELVLETARLVGVGAVNLMHTIDPEMVLIGGAMTFGGHDSELGRRFLEEIRSEVRRRAFPVLAERVRIDFASLGGDAGTVGAAGVARLAHLNKHVA